jgi:3-ketoacyl-CoA synthase
VDDESYECVYECQDDKFNHGVRLSKQIVKVAGRAMEQNFTSLGPHVLPVTEMMKVARAWVLRDVFKV